MDEENKKNKKGWAGKIAVLVAIIIVAYFGLSQTIFKQKETGFRVVKAEMRNIVQEISETGTVKKGEETRLSFKNGGRIEKIWVKAGDNVVKGEALAKVDISEVSIKLSEAKANLLFVKAKLEKLMAGASNEEKASAETAVLNAETAVKNAEHNLENIKASAENNLLDTQEDAKIVLNSAYLTISNSFNVAALIERTYFSANDQEGILVRESVEKIEKFLSVENDLAKMEGNLNIVSDALKKIRDICEETKYRNIVSSTDKASLDTQRTNINTALTNVVNSEQAISSVKLTNEYNINYAGTSLSSTKGTLASAQNSLALLIAPPRQEDVNSYKAQVVQAESSVALLENQLKEAVLRSPSDGQIIRVEGKEGEMQVAGSLAMSFLPTALFEIEVNIYEEDIAKINLGDPAGISLIAFPDKKLNGEVIAIDPAEELIEGVVYYKTKISIKDAPEEVRPGMTADIDIKKNIKENVLTIPSEAVGKENGKAFVQYLKNGKIEKKEIIIGAQGSGGLVEIISGLSEGDEIRVK